MPSHRDLNVLLRVPSEGNNSRAYLRAGSYVRVGVPEFGVCGESEVVANARRWAHDS